MQNQKGMWSREWCDAWAVAQFGESLLDSETMSDQELAGNTRELMDILAEPETVEIVDS